jgi:predicted CXXCH cytochrome family protein
MSRLAVAVAALAGAHCGATHPSASRPGGGALAGAATATVTSNILRGDYAGSESCAGCHAEIFAAWRGSPMRLMTRTAQGAIIHPTRADPRGDPGIRAPFDGGPGSTLHFKDDTARLVQEGGTRFVELTSARSGDHRYRVTRVIGGRYREDFAGVEDGVAGAAELLLPVSYVFETKSLRVKGYSVLVGERPGLRAGGVWSQTCVFCHNTVPYFDAVWGELAGPGAPAYQGTVVDKLLPRDRRWQLVVDAGGEPALRDAVTAEVAAVGGQPAPPAADLRATLVRGIGELRTHFDGGDLVEVGIGCEACHGGSREHVARPSVHPSFAPRSPFLGARREAGGGITRAEEVNRVCARCHQVLFSRYLFTWEGGTRRPGKADAAGGSSINSGEARDFLMGGCAQRMSCTTCHDPHTEDKRADLDRLATVAGNAVCVRCHSQYAPPAALAAHAHHQPDGAGASCIGCHMPKKNMGLGYALTRYHRIGRPDDPARVERDRPIECALCHADKTVTDLVSTMERWWGRQYSRAALADLYGALDARPLVATLTRGKAHEQAVAVTVLGDARRTEATAGVARQLANPFPLVRYYARRALESLLPRPCPVDLDRTTPEIVSAVRACVPAAFPEGAALPGGRGRGDDADED